MNKIGAKVPKKQGCRSKGTPRHADPPEDSLSLWVQHLKKSFLITLLVGTVLLFAASLGCYFLPDPYPWIRPMSVAASMLTAAVGGFSCVKLHKHSALLCGLLNGSLLMLLMLLLSLFLKPYAAGYSAGISALLHLATLLFSVAGAFLGLHGKPKKRKR